MLLRILKADKSGASSAWLAANPEFLESAIIQKLPNRALINVLESLAKSEPAFLMRFLRNSISIDSQIFTPNFWSAVVRALDKIGTGAADELFANIVVGQLKAYPSAGQPILDQEPATSLLARTVWTIAGRVDDEKTWNVLFDAAGANVSNDALLKWLNAADSSQPTLKRWIVESYVPRLFERGLLSSNFVTGLEDISSQVSLVNALCGRISEHRASLRTVSTEWSKIRYFQKTKLAERAALGLRLSLRATLNNETLRTRLDKLSDVIERWRSTESPEIDPSIVLAAEIPVAGASPASIETLNVFFSSARSTIHEIGLFFAANPWAISLFLSSNADSWPKLELIVEQIVKSLVFFANVNEYAMGSIRDLPENTRIDLAVAVRDGLDELEEMMVGYFMFRSILRDVGLDQVAPALGESLKPEDISSEKHKLLRDSSQSGRLRVLSLGLKVGNRIVGSSKVIRSGEKDDSD
jgi:hypothetical protein